MIAGPEAIPDADGFTVMDWSPDGRWIVADVRKNSGVGDLYLIDPSGTAAPVNVTNNPARYDAVSWSPDGSSLVFIKRADGAPFDEAEIYALRQADRQLVQLTKSVAEYSSVDWSPDGSRVIYGREQDAAVGKLSDLFIVNADGTGTRQLTAGSHWSVYPSWAP